MFCNNCGKEIDPSAIVCIHCGCAVNKPTNTIEGQKSKLAAGLLAILLGLGIHNFYLGFNGKAVAQLILSFCGVGYIWCLIDGIMILTGSINQDAKGFPLKD